MGKTSGDVYNAAWSRAREGSPFSNGTEGECWQAHWCDRCLRDAPFRNGITSTGCPLLLVALSGRTPVEWLEQPWQQVRGAPEGVTAPSLGDQYHCIEFRSPGDGGGEPRPTPTPRDQGELFERWGHEGRRVLRPLPEQESPVRVLV